MLLIVLPFHANPGLRRHRIKNTSKDFKHIERPRLVQTEALFDEDGCFFFLRVSLRLDDTETLFSPVFFFVETDMVHCFNENTMT